MIDVGGPSMLRGAAKNFAHVAPVCRPEQYEPVLDELRDARRAVARDAPLARRRGVRDDGRVRGGDRALVRRDASRSPTSSRSASRRSPTSPTARTRTSAPRTTASSARAATCSRASSSSRGRELSFNNLADLDARAAARARVRAAGLRDRQAREPVRRRASRRRSRRRTSARSPPTRSRPSAAWSSSTGRSAPSSARAIAEQFVEVLLAPGYDDEALEALRAKPATADPRRPRAARVEPRRARLQARARRPARPGPRLRRRGPRGDGGRRRRADRGAVGRPAVRLAGVQARRARTRSCSRRACRRSGSAPGR